MVNDICHGSTKYLYLLGSQNKGPQAQTKLLRLEAASHDVAGHKASESARKGSALGLSLHSSSLLACGGDAALVFT